MRIHPSSLTSATLIFLGSLCVAAPAWAQVADATTTVEATVTEWIQLAKGRSVKKSLMGKTIYNDADRKVGKVTPGTIKAMPEFSYAADTTKCDAFVASADKEIANGKARVAALEKRAGASNADAKSGSTGS